MELVPVSLHSSGFKTKAQFGVDKTVLILGSGETGMDVAYMDGNSPTKRDLLSHRDGFLCAPKVRTQSTYAPSQVRV
jgi:dimethylaniline monooxygenase (N-oxide forming)